MKSDKMLELRNKNKELTLLKAVPDSQQRDLCAGIRIDPDIDLRSK
jgi:hypothetical protein